MKKGEREREARRKTNKEGNGYAKLVDVAICNRDKD